MIVTDVCHDTFRVVAGFKGGEVGCFLWRLERSMGEEGGELFRPSLFYISWQLVARAYSVSLTYSLCSPSAKKRKRKKRGDNVSGTQGPRCYINAKKKRNRLPLCVNGFSFRTSPLSEEAHRRMDKAL